MTYQVCRVLVELNFRVVFHVLMQIHFTEADIRKAALAISYDVENLARRMQKLLERKKRKEEGNTVLADKPSKENSHNIVVDSNVVGRKRARVDDVR